jgi:ankyrin repeat protein
VKIAIIAGWILLAIETALVLYMFVQPNVGDDAAGRGMALGFGIILGPVLLISAALFIWGQRGGPRVAFWTGFGIMAIPLAFIVINSGSRKFGELDRAAGKARSLTFDDKRLTRLSRAIEAEDTATVRAIIAEGPVDFTARSRAGRTPLGRAIEHAADYWSTPVALEPVRMLLAAGAKPLPNVISPEYSQGEPDAHLMIAWVFGQNYKNTLPLLDMLFAAGADPNTRDNDGAPLYISPQATLPVLEMFAKHGADFTATDTRSDRLGWSGAMVAAQLGKWDLVSFFLEHGVRVDHRGADGTTLRSIIAEKKKEGASSEDLAPVMRSIEAALRAGA